MSLSTYRRDYYDMLVDLGSRFLSIRRWKILIAFYGSVFVGATGYSYYLHFFSSFKSSKKKKKKKKRTGTGIIEELKRLLPLSFGHTIFSSSFGHFILYSSMLFIRVLTYAQLADIGAIGMKCLVNKDWDLLFLTQSRFMTLCIPVSMVNAFARYEQHQLALSIRSNLLTYINSCYLNKYATFYRVNSFGKNLLSTVDQRVTTDIEQFSEKLAETWGSMLRPTFEIVVYSYNIYINLGLPQLVFFIGYFFGTSIWLKSIMPHFGKMLSKSKDLEGKFRQNHSSIIEHSEEIAFLKGGEVENKRCEETFKEIKQNRHKVLENRMLISFLDTTAIKHFGTLVSYEVMIPAMYLGREGIKLETHGDRTQFLIQAIQYFTSLGNALNTLYNAVYVGFTELAGMTTRVVELIDELERRGGNDDGNDLVAKMFVEKHRLLLRNNNRLNQPQRFNSKNILFNKVTIFSPEGRLLVKDLNLSICQGENLIIEGPNGAGKSSLLRTIGGLWPLLSGALHSPQDGIVFVPQKPYVFKGSLVEQIVYPDEELTLNGTTVKKNTPHLESLLKKVGLDVKKLLPKENQWNDVLPWNDILSGGERQRLALARVLYHSPQYVCLDEATSAISKDIETTLFELCKQQNITLISVSHRPYLRRFHSQVLTIKGDGKGSWEVKQVEN